MRRRATSCAGKGPEERKPKRVLSKLRERSRRALSEARINVALWGQINGPRSSRGVKERWQRGRSRGVRQTLEAHDP